MEKYIFKDDIKLKDPLIDPNGCCVEMFLNGKNVRNVVRINLEKQLDREKKKNKQLKLILRRKNMSTITLHRVFKAAPDKIYRAFLDADAQAKWLPPNGFTCRVHHLDAKVGGTYKTSFTNFSTGKSSSFGGRFLELEPGKQIRYSDQFDDPNLPGEMITTITIKPVSCGSEVTIIQDGVPDVIPPEYCYLGWQESLDQLTKLVEPVIPD